MKKYITEFIGTFFLVIVIGLTVNGGIGPMAPLGIGFTLIALIYAGGHVSGAHYNPAVTLAVFIRKKIPGSDVIPYVLAQLSGAALAAITTSFLIPGKMPVEAPLMHDLWRALVAELIGTFALVYVVLNVATAKSTAGNSYYGLAIGLTVIGIAYAFGEISGGAFNPAVALSICIMKMLSWNYIWLYLAGSAVAAAIAAFLFNSMHKDEN
ncbi:MAG: MIP/aquaporin family protein [Bacteroidia bacterium]